MFLYVFFSGVNVPTSKQLDNIMYPKKTKQTTFVWPKKVFIAKAKMHVILHCQSFTRSQSVTVNIRMEMFDMFFFFHYK